MNFLKRLSCGIDSLNEWIGKGVAWVTLGLVLVVFIDVIMRYLFNTSFVFIQELEWHLFALAAARFGAAHRLDRRSDGREGEDQPDRRADEGAGEADEQSGSRAIDDPRENIATEVIGSEDEGAQF